MQRCELLVLSLIVATTACAPGQPGAGPAAPGREAPAVSASPPGPAAKPAPKPTPGGEWEQIVAAAKREGKVSVLGPPGADYREALTEGFDKAYPDISAEFSGQSGAEAGPKLLSEVAAGRSLTDVVVLGTTTILMTMRPANALTPLRSFLVGPNSSDESKWTGGKFDFGDDAAEYNLVLFNRVQVPFMYNPQSVSPQEFSSYKDLLNPKWKGKMTSRDPRQGGAAQDLVTFLYTVEDLGKDFLRQLFAQDIVIFRDDRQALDLLTRGQYPIAIGPDVNLAFEMKGRGLPVDFFPGEAMREGGFLTASSGTIAVVRDAPHPNASKVYLDYLLSRDAQLAWSKATGLASRRLDVPRDHLPEAFVPKEGVNYRHNHREPYLLLRDEVVEFLRTILPS